MRHAQRSLSTASIPFAASKRFYELPSLRLTLKKKPHQPSERAVDLFYLPQQKDRPNGPRALESAEMSRLRNHFIKAADFGEAYGRVLQREGGLGAPLIQDSGGWTNAGVSQNYFGKNPDGSFKKSKEQIAALTPEQIKAVYADIYSVPNKVKDPRVREVLFDMTTNAGGPNANAIFQRALNRLLPPDKQIAVDRVVGSGTLAAASSVDQAALANQLLDGYSAHHQMLLKKNPAKYGEAKNGWPNRIKALRQQVQGMPAPAPSSPPVLVKGRLQAPALGSTPVLVKKPRHPIMVDQPSVSAPASPAPQETVPGGPIPSIPLLSAPATSRPVKSASLQGLTKLDAALTKLWSYRQSGMLAGGNHAENMRQVWRTSDILRARFKKPPTLDEAFNHVGGLLRDGEVGSIAKKATTLPYKDGELTSELEDLAQVVKNKRLGDIPEALDEVAYAGQRWYGKAFDSKRRITGPKAKKVRQREAVWRSAFARRRIPFSPHYLSSGDDFSNPTTVRNAFLSAGKQISDAEALQLSLSMSGAFKANTGESDDLLKLAHMLQTMESVGRSAKKWVSPDASPFAKLLAQLKGRNPDRLPTPEESEFFVQKALASFKKPEEDSIVAIHRYMEGVARAKRERFNKAFGADSADRVTMEHLGSVYSVAKPSAPPSDALGQLLLPFTKQGSLSSLKARLRKAYNETHTYPTPQQARAGNYKKGRVNYKGLLIAIENPPGSVRRGVDDEGKPWESTLTCAYGYFTGASRVKEALWSGGHNGVQNLEADAHALPAPDTSSVQGLRRPWNHGLRKMAGLFELPIRHGGASAWHVLGSNRQQQRILSGELPMGHPGRAGDQHPQHPARCDRREKHASASSNQGSRPAGEHGLRQVGRWLEFGEGAGNPGGSGASGATWNSALFLRGRNSLSLQLGAEARRQQSLTVKAAGARLDVPTSRGDAEQKDTRLLTPEAADLLQRPDDVDEGVVRGAGDSLRRSEASVLARLVGKEGFRGSVEKAAAMPRAADGDGVDVFIGPDHDSDLVVVIDQYKGKTFDESKFCIGVKTREQGERLYLSNYPRGWKLGPVSTTTVQQLKEWLKNGDTKSPFEGQMVKAAFVKQDEETGKWILWTRDKKRKLGTHDTPEEAYAQEYAIQKSQEVRAKSASLASALKRQGLISAPPRKFSWVPNSLHPRPPSLSCRQEQRTSVGLFQKF